MASPDLELPLTSPEHVAVSEEELGNVLAAVGNHEGKATVLLGMEPNRAYGVTALHNLYVGPQDTVPAHRGATGNQLDYCTYSFEPVGAVAKVSNGDGVKYEITEAGEGLGKAAAGYMLDLSWRHPEVSLRQIFGLTKAKNPELRSPRQRIQLVRALLADSSSTSAARLSEITGLPTKNTTNNLSYLHEAGLLEYASTLPGEYDLAFSAPREISEYAPAHKRPSLTAAAVKAVNQLRQQTDTVTFSDIEKELRQDARYAHQKALSSNLITVLRALQKQGHLVQTSTFQRGKLSDVFMTDAQRAVLGDVIEVVDSLQSADAAAILEGKQRGQAILADPAKVNALIRKAITNSPEANKVPQQERFGLVINFLVESEVATTDEVIAALAERKLTKRSVTSTLQKMRSLGLVESVLDGRQNLWAVQLRS